MPLRFLRAPMPSPRLFFAAVLALAAACTSSPAPLPREEPEGLEALPDDVHYVALGDSIAAGAGATTTYVEQFAGRVETELGRNVEVTNLAGSGWTTSDLLEAVRNNPAVREAVADADIVTWNIGGNDLLRVLAEIGSGICPPADIERCVRRTVDTLTGHWDAIVAEIVGLQRDDAVVLRTMDVYHPFVTEHRRAGLFETLAPYLDQVNGHIAEANGRQGIRVAGVHVAFNGPDGAAEPAAKGLLAADGVHPSDAGQMLIAEVLFDLG